MDALLLSSTRWRSPWLSKQHLAVALADRGHGVLYVDPPVSPLSPIRQPERWRELLGRGRRIQAGVCVWTPIVLPGQNLGLAQSWNAGHVVRGSRRQMARPDLTVAFGLEARTALSRSPGVRVYHCTDSWSDHPGIDADRARSWEDAMIAGADVVLACSQPLVDTLADRGVAARYLPHGVDPSPDDVVADQALVALPRPRIGYAGGLNFRLSPELLEAAIDAVPGGTLVLIGSSWRSAKGAIDPRLDAILERDDVVTVDHRTGPSFASALAALDVGLVPYAPTPFNRRSFPLKVMQYLAAGLPVVSTPNGATDEHPDHVVVAADTHAFGAAVERAAKSPSRGADERRAAARARPWTQVADELLVHAGLGDGSIGPR